MQSVWSVWYSYHTHNHPPSANRAARFFSKKILQLDNNNIKIELTNKKAGMRFLKWNKILIIFSLILVLGSMIFFYFYKSAGTKKISAATGSKTLTSQAEWQAGTNTNTDLLTTPGSIKIDDKASVSQLDITGSSVTTTRDDGGHASQIVDNIPNAGWYFEPLTTDKEYATIDFGEEFTFSKYRNNTGGAAASQYCTYYSTNGVDYTAMIGYEEGVGTTNCMGGVWNLDPMGPGFYFDLTPAVTARYVKIEAWSESPFPFQNEVGVTDFDIFYNPTATHTSAATQLDGTADFTAWTTFEPNGTIPANTSINFRFRTSNDHVTWTDWSDYETYAASIDLSGLDQRRYLQVESTLTNIDGASSPTLADYTANYTYDDTCTDFDHITMTPNTASVSTGGHTTFSTTAYDSLSAPMAGVTFNYNASCGSIDGSGNYTAPATAQTCIISVTSSCGGNDSSTVTVTSTPAPTPEPEPEPDEPDQCQGGMSECTGDAYQALQNCLSDFSLTQEQRESCISNWCSTYEQCAVACTGGTGMDQFNKLKVVSPEEDQIYHLSETIPVKWYYINGTGDWDGTKHLYDPAYVEMYLSTNGGESYSLIKTLFNNRRHAYLNYYKSRNPKIATDYYYNYPNQDKVYSASEDIQDGFHYYNFTLPISQSIVSDNIKIKLNPVQTCDATQPGESDSFKIRELPNAVNLYVNPQSQSIKLGQYGNFTAKTYDQYGQDITGSTTFEYSLTPDASDGGTLQDLDGGNFRVQGKKTGTYAYGVYVKATSNDVSSFTYVSFAVYEGTLSLDYVRIDPGDIQFKRGESAYYKAKPIDQYGMAFPQADINWKVLNSKAGTIKEGSVDEIGIFTASNNQGCYPYIIEATATYGDKTYRAYSSLSIGSEEYVEDPNADGKDGIKTDQNIELTGSYASPGNMMTRAGKPTGFYGYAYDGRNNRYAASDTNSLANYLPGLSVIVKSYNAALFDVSFDGATGYVVPKVGTAAGTYDSAVTIQASYKGKTFESNIKVVVVDGNPKYGFSVVTPYGSYYGNAKYRTNLNTNLKTYYYFEMPKGGILSTWLGAYSEEGYYYTFGPVSVQEKLSSQFTNLAGNRTTLYFKAPNTAGLYKKAVTYIVKVDGKTYTYDIDINVTDDTTLLSKCYVTPCDGCESCDPTDAGCCDPASQDCNVCLNPPCGDYDDGGGGGILCRLFGGRDCPTIIKAIDDNGALVFGGLAALGFLLPTLSGLLSGFGTAGMAATASGSTGSALSRFLTAYKGKKQHPWGVIYDKYSKKPIPNVKVYLFSWPDHKLIDTQTTNDVGEFAFLAPAGQYYFKVEKRGYYITELANKSKTQMLTTSSQLLSKFKPFKAKRTDGYYSNIYLIPEVITQRGDKKQPLEVSIPMIPANIKPSGFIRFWAKFMYIIEILRLPLLILGSFFVIVDVATRAAWYDWVLLGVYIILWIVEIYTLIFLPKTWGEIRDKKGKAVDLALVRLMNKETGRIVSTSVTGRDGRFVFNVNPGDYVIKISKEGLKDYYSKPFTVKHLKNMGNLKFIV